MNDEVDAMEQQEEAWEKVEGPSHWAYHMVQYASINQTTSVAPLNEHVVPVGQPVPRVQHPVPGTQRGTRLQEGRLEKGQCSMSNWQRKGRPPSFLLESWQ